MRHLNLKTIAMKYSVSSHSCMQEIDNAHSQIENKIKKLEIWSLMRNLLFVNNKYHFWFYNYVQMISKIFMILHNNINLI